MHRRVVRVLGSLLLLAGLASCSLFGASGVSTAACPALRPNVSALDAQYSANAQISGKIAAFVQAAKDMAAVSGQMEVEAANACRRIGADIGVPPQQMQVKDGPGGQASGACDVVYGYIQQILSQGVTLTAQLQPPSCQANAQAKAHCAGRCDVNNDAECRASCDAHAEVNASCTPALVTVQASGNMQAAARLIASLQVNLPALVHAQITLGQRLLQHAQVVAQVGANMPKLIGQAGAQAAACVAAAADISAAASVRVQVSVKASANVSAQAGVH